MEEYRSDIFDELNLIQKDIEIFNENNLNNFNWVSSPIFLKIWIYDLEYKANTLCFIPFKLYRYNIVVVPSFKDLPLLMRIFDDR